MLPCRLTGLSGGGVLGIVSPALPGDPDSPSTSPSVNCLSESGIPSSRSPEGYRCSISRCCLCIASGTCLDKNSEYDFWDNFPTVLMSAHNHMGIVFDNAPFHQSSTPGLLDFPDGLLPFGPFPFGVSFSVTFEFYFVSCENGIFFFSPSFCQHRA